MCVYTRVKAYLSDMTYLSEMSYMTYQASRQSDRQDVRWADDRMGKPSDGKANDLCR